MPIIVVPPAYVACDVLGESTAVSSCSPLLESDWDPGISAIDGAVVGGIVFVGDDVEGEAVTGELVEGADDTGAREVGDLDCGAAVACTGAGEAGDAVFFGISSCCSNAGGSV